MTATIRPATKPEIANKWCIRWPDRLIQPTSPLQVSSVRHPRNQDQVIALAEPVELATGVWYVIEYWEDAPVPAM